MLGRLVIHASRLQELDGEGLRIAALGRGGADEASFLDGLRADLADIAHCRHRLGEKAVIDVLETKPPPGLVPGMAAAQDAGLRVFLEIPAGTKADLPPGIGVKVRTGGLEAAAFPPCADLAATLAWAMRHRVPFKATAGLHHPLPRPDAGLGARMHGFVNVFGAAALAAGGVIDEEEVRQVLEEESPEAFAFDEQALSWRGRRLGLEALREARALAVSFGSCSFDEPRDDLRALGWM